VENQTEMEIKTPPNIHAHIFTAWYNGSYTMATQPINFLELHYTMTQFLTISVSQPLPCFLYCKLQNGVYILEEPCVLAKERHNLDELEELKFVTLPEKEKM